jgi:hypothetical protein
MSMYAAAGLAVTAPANPKRGATDHATYGIGRHVE